MNEQHEALSASWPGGWYVYENGKVEGPMSADAAFSLAAETVDGKPRLVSRKGFSQWYALKDLSEIFRLTDRLGRQAAQTTEQAVQEVKSTREATAAVQANQPGAAGSGLIPETVAHPPAPRVQKGQRRAAKTMRTTSIVTPVAAAAPKSGLSSDTKAGMATGAAAPSSTVGSAAVASATQSMLGNVAPPTAREAVPGPSSPTEAKPLPTGTPKAAHSAKSAARPLTAKALLMQEYFLQRGRLRLGKIRNPWATAFLGLPLSLGAYWAVWFSDLAREAAWHTRGEEAKGLSGWLAVVPIIHFFMVYKLAKLIVEVEAQNRYRSISPAVATLFAIFPPFALAYLQDAANRHWLLHARHALAGRRQGDSAI